VKGSGKILAKLEEKLGIQSGDCQLDGKFSLESSRCIGACGLAPVFTINEDVYGRVKEDGSELDAILAKYQD
ncbi:MAG: NAD(P)H-dependent oxidoreductase subunit E, partial [Anaerotignum sp.]|nr:NAD(P)H-dependent oxidoreductase subunit E [Anaerotignum sp.]